MKDWWKNDTPDYLPSIGAGLSEGVAGVAGMPADLWWLAIWARDKRQARRETRSYDDVAAENDRNAWMPDGTLERWGGHALNEAYGFQYEPKTTTGKFLRTGTSFATTVAGGPLAVPKVIAKVGIASTRKAAIRRGLRELDDRGKDVLTHGMRREALADAGKEWAKDVATYGALAGLASEFAGQVTKETPYERLARIGAGLLAGGGAYYGRHVASDMRPLSSFADKAWAGVRTGFWTGVQAGLGGGRANSNWNMRHPRADSFAERYGATGTSPQSMPWLGSYPAESPF